MLLTEDDKRSNNGYEGYINEGVSKIVVFEMGKQSFGRERRNRGKSREQSRGKKCISNNKENRGWENKQRHNHGDQEEQGLQTPQYPFGFLFLWKTHLWFLCFVSNLFCFFFFFFCVYLQREKIKEHIGGNSQGKRGEKD